MLRVKNHDIQYANKILYLQLRIPVQTCQLINYEIRKWIRIKVVNLKPESLAGFTGIRNIHL